MATTETLTDEPYIVNAAGNLTARFLIPELP